MGIGDLRRQKCFLDGAMTEEVIRGAYVAGDEGDGPR
jgi:hypothetical protein